MMSLEDEERHDKYTYVFMQLPQMPHPSRQKLLSGTVRSVGPCFGQEQRTASILIIPGSGPTDRDGNNRLGVNGSPYELLAKALL